MIADGGPITLGLPELTLENALQPVLSKADAYTIITSPSMRLNGACVKIDMGTSHITWRLYYWQCTDTGWKTPLRSRT